MVLEFKNVEGFLIYFVSVEKSNEIYFGEFKNDVHDGIGFFINLNETIYYGNWKNNVP